MLEKSPECKSKIKESHPELCFAILRSEDKNIKPIDKSKHTKEGQSKRIEVLKKYYDKTSEFVEHISNNPKFSNKKVDCIDALCLAVTGMLGLENGFRCVPEKPAIDSHGLAMQMVYAEKPGR